MKNVFIWGAFVLLVVTLPVWAMPVSMYYAFKYRGGWRRELEKEQLG
jgi:hypothetical protein